MIFRVLRPMILIFRIPGIRRYNRYAYYQNVMYYNAYRSISIECDV